MTRTADQVRRQVTEGTIEDDTLRMKPVMPAGRPVVPGRATVRPSVEVIAHRLGSAQAARRLAALAPPPKQPLPALRDLPDNGLARTPPMGWNSWNRFHCDVSDQLIRQIADAMVSSGMRDAGYVYLNVDDCWMGTRDAQGNIHGNERFPDMKALGDYIHSKGLKFGIYSSPGPKTCQLLEGSLGHEQQDARSYASWGVDYLKYDWCTARAVYSGDEQRAVYQKMGEALQKLERPIVYALCQYGQNGVGEWGVKVGGNLWRTTGDIGDRWDSMERIGFSQDVWTKFASIGHWNDPDMLEIGNGGMTDIEYTTHLSLWALLAAPLLAGNDLRSMNQATRAILMNKEVIAVNQDPLGKPAHRVMKDGPLEAWVRPLKDGSCAAGLFNLGTEPAKVKLKLSDAGVAEKVQVRDLWMHQDRGAAEGSVSAMVAGHGVALLRLRR